MIKSILGGKSKNLFDISKADVVINANIFNPIPAKWDCFYKMPVTSGQTYTVSYDTKANAGVGEQLQLAAQTGDKYLEGTILFVFLTTPEMLKDWVHTEVTFTIPDNTTQITFSALEDKFFRNFQIELGSTATEYVPHELTSYKSIMKVSDVCQLVDKSKIPTTRTISGVTFTNNGDGSVTVNGTSTHQYYSEIVIPIDGSLFIPGHVYLNGTIKGDFAGFVALYGPVAKDYIMEPQFIYTLPSGKDFYRFRYIIRVRRGMTANNYKCTPQPFDLTEMFGAGNEPKTVAEFKAKFPNDYYPYSPSCFVTSYDERMPCKTKNLFDINAEMHDANKPEYYIEVMGNIVKTNYDISHVRHPYIEVPVEIGETYTFSCNAYRSSDIIDVYSRVRYPDNTVVTYIGNRPINKTFTATQSSIQVCFGIDTHGTWDTSQFVFIYDIQLVKGTTATDYVPYGYV